MPPKCFPRERDTAATETSVVEVCGVCKRWLGVLKAEFLERGWMTSLERGGTSGGIVVLLLLLLLVDLGEVPWDGAKIS